MNGLMLNKINPKHTQIDKCHKLKWCLLVSHLQHLITLHSIYFYIISATFFLLLSSIDSAQLMILSWNIRTLVTAQTRIRKVQAVVSRMSSTRRWIMNFEKNDKKFKSADKFIFDVYLYLLDILMSLYYIFDIYTYIPQKVIEKTPSIKIHLVTSRQTLQV